MKTQFPIIVRDIQEVAIALLANQFNLALLQEIIPEDWKPEIKPVVASNCIKFCFQNNVKILAYPQRITFIEKIAARELLIEKIAHKYVENQPSIKYQGIVINPKRFFSISSQQNAAKKYIRETLLGSGDWKNIGKQPVQAGINLFYQLERCKFNLSINEAIFPEANREILGLLFSGIFHYNVSDYKLDELHQVINNTQTDLANFLEIINQKFLG